MGLLDDALKAKAAMDVGKMLERLVKSHENIAKELKKANDLKAAEVRRGGRR